MRQRSFKVLSLFLALVMCLSVLPVYRLTVEAAASEAWLWPVPSLKTTNNPYTYNKSTKKGHAGLDIPAGEGSNVFATKSGTIYTIYFGCKNNKGYYNSCANAKKGCKPIKYTLNSNGKVVTASAGTFHGCCNGGFGIGIIIKHDDNTFSQYAHLKSVKFGKESVGKRVAQGEVIGSVGSTGYSSGPHLHFSITKGSTDKYYSINNNIKQLAYVYTVPMVKPDPPKISSSVSGDVAVNTPVTVSWSKVNNATGYKVYVNGSQVNTTTGTSYSFKASEAKKYEISVYASNSKYTSSVSNKISVTAHKPLSVTFVNWDDTPLTKSALSVDYGKNAVAPTIPEREGYTFIGWDKSFSNVKEDLVVRAQYKINTYNVRFLDSKGNELSKQKVEYGSAAVEPENKNVPTGYEFLGWSTDAYQSVKEDLNVYGVYDWGNRQLPIVAQITSAARQEDGYYVYFNLTNYPDDITRGRAVVSLKTAQGKLVDTTESAAFSIPKNGTKNGMEVFIPCDVAATKVELVIVNSYSSGVPISQMVTSNISSGLAWSAWSVTAPQEGTYSQVESKKQYRYQDKQFSTATSKTKDGWTLYNTTSTTSSGTTTSPISSFSNDAQKRTVTTRTVNNYSTRTLYRYMHYRKGNSTSPKRYDSSWSTIHYTSWRTSKLSKQGTSSEGGIPKYGSVKCASCGLSAYWYKEETKTESYVSGTTTYYDYTDTFYTYHFYKWGAYSDWSDQKVDATSNRNVQERTVYRYRGNFNDAGLENNEGQSRTVEGSLGSAYANKQLALFIYKVDEASDFTNEYVGQTLTNENGDYSFSFKLREEPSVKTGDMTVAIGLEGSNNTIIIDTIEAPKPTYEVNFFLDGQKLCETQNVEEGSSAVLPENPVKEGYTFVGWNADTTNIRSNSDISALFVKNKYTVVFVDFVAETVNVKEFYHGDALIPPEMAPINGYNFAGWNELIGDNAVVTENMVLTAKYDKESYTVNFYDYENNLISTQTVEYGEPAQEPDAPEIGNMTFEYWDCIDDLNNITDDLDVSAKYVFNETCALPSADIETGEYESEQYVTLSCDSENAVIFYTTDGTDPKGNDGNNSAKLYNGPILIDQSCVLKYYATAMNMNDSEVTSETYAINNGNTESGLMLYSDIPEIVMNNLDKYSLKNETGYRYKDVISTSSTSEAESLESSGWTFLSLEESDWSDWSMTQDAPSDSISTYETRDPDPVDTPFYKYSHWKYTDGDETICSPVEVEGKDGEWEYIELANSLSISAFVSNTPAYTYHGEKWYSQTLITKGVVPDYTLYRYKVQTKSFFKWTDWTLSAPAEDEEREYESAVVFRYSIPVMHIVTVHPLWEDDDSFSVFAYDGDLVTLGNDFYFSDGYDISGYYLDEEKTLPIDLSTEPITESIDVYPSYTAKSFSITFQYENGEIIDTQTVEFCENALEPQLEIPEGYIFIGWDSDKYLGVDSDAVLTAIIKPESEVSTVYLTRESVKLYVDSMIYLKAYTSLEGTEITWSSSNYDVADVDESGLVTALSAGVATITASTPDRMKATCVITVEGDESSKITLNEDASIGFDNVGYIRGIKAGQNSVSEVSEQFKNSNLIFKSPDGEELSGEMLVTTGTVVELRENDILIDSHTIIITGDVNCDGKINNRDVAYVTRYLVNKESADNEYQLIALDTNGDGRLNNRDAAMLSRYLVGKESI